MSAAPRKRKHKTEILSTLSKAAWGMLDLSVVRLPTWITSLNLQLAHPGKWRNMLPIIKWKGTRRRPLLVSLLRQMRRLLCCLLRPLLGMRNRLVLSRAPTKLRTSIH